MFDIGSIVVGLEANTRDLRKGLGKAEKNLSSFKSAVSKKVNNINDKFKSIGSGIEGVGNDLTALSVGAVAGIGGAIKMFVGFDDQMRKIKAVTGATDEEMGRLTTTAEDLGSKTKFSSREAAGAMEMLARAGFSTNEIIKATPGLLDLAAVSGEDLGTTADRTSDILTAFNLEAEDTGRVVDVLGTTSTNSNATIGQLSESMKYAAPIADNFGLSIEETSAFLGILADNGIKGSQAGTSLRSMLQRLAAPTDDAKALLNELNVSTTDSQGNMRSLTDILDDYRQSSKGLSEEQQIANNKILAGTEGSSALTAAVGTTDSEFQEFISTLETSEGKTSDMASMLEDGAGGAFRELRSQLETTATKFGNLFEPMLVNTIIPAISSLNDEIQKLIDWFKSQDQETQDLITKMVLFGVAIGPVLLLVGKLIAIGTAIAGVLSGPVAIAIGAVVGAVLLLQQNWEKLNGDGKGLWETIKGFGKTLRDEFVPKMKRVWIQVKAWGSAILDFLQPSLDRLWNVIQDNLLPLFKQWWNEFQALLPVLKAIGAVIGAVLVAGIYLAINALTLFLKGWAFVQGVLSNVREFIWNFISKVIDFFWWLYKKLIGNSIIPDMLNGIKDFFVNTLNAVKDFVWGNLKKVAKFFFNFALDVLRTIVTRFNKIRHRVKAIILRIRQIIGDVFSRIWGTINHYVKEAWKTVSRIFSDIWGTINHWISSAWTTISNIFRDIWGTINHYVSSAKNTVSDIFSNIWSTINHWVHEVWGTVNHVFTSLKDTVFEKFDSWKGHITGVIDGIKGWFTNQSKTIQDAITGPFNQAKSWIEDLFNGLNIGNILKDKIRGLPGGQKILNNLPGFANGVRDFAGGPAIVGERGAEIMNIPKGANITPASRTESMLGRSNGGSQKGINIGTINISKEVDSDKFFRELDRRQYRENLIG